MVNQTERLKIKNLETVEDLIMCEIEDDED